MIGGHHHRGRMIRSSSSEAPERIVLLDAGAKHVPRHECMDWRWLIVIRGRCVCQNDFVALSNFTRYVHLI